MLLGFVDGHPISAVTTKFLAWYCKRLAAQSKRVLLLIWDDAAWHVSREVRAWLRIYNQQVKREKKGVRILAGYLPIRSPGSRPSNPSGPILKSGSSSPTASATPSPALTNLTSSCPNRSPEYALGSDISARYALCTGASCR